MITSLHGEIVSQSDHGSYRVVCSRGLGRLLWSVYDPERPFGMKVGATKAEATAKWLAAHPVKVAA